MKKLIVIMILAASALNSIAQQHTLTLEDSRKAALSYSAAIRNGQLQVKSAEAGIHMAKANSLPSVSATGVGLYGFKDFVQPIPGVLDKGLGNLYLLGATATQTIYAGGKVGANRQLADLQLQSTKLSAQQSLDSVLLLTTQKYWNIVNLQEQGKTIKANEILLNSILKTQKDMLAAGLIARNDLLKVKVQLSQLLVNKSKLKNSHILALYDFSAYTGITFDSLTVMQDTLTKEGTSLLSAAGPDTATNNLTNYRLLALQVKGSAIQSRLTKADNLPSISVGLSASQAGSFNKAFASTFTPVAFGTLSIPISENIWGSNRQKLRQKKLNEQITVNNLEDGRNQLQVGILKYWYAMKDALTQISYAKDNMLQARENMKVSQDNYQAGLSSTSDLLDAQASYMEAEVTLNTAFTNFQIDKATYDFFIGKIAAR